VAADGYAARGPRIPSADGQTTRPVRKHTPNPNPTMATQDDLSVLRLDVLEAFGRQDRRVSYLLPPPGDAAPPTSLPLPTTCVPAGPPPSNNQGQSKTDKPSPSSFTPKELASRWGTYVEKVVAFIRSGELPAFNVASPASKRPRYRVLATEVERFERETRAVARPTAPRPEPTRRRRKKAALPPARKNYF